MTDSGVGKRRRLRREHRLLSAIRYSLAVGPVILLDFSIDASYTRSWSGAGQSKEPPYVFSQPSSDFLLGP
jgi:hypothetical protein